MDTTQRNRWEAAQQVAKEQNNPNVPVVSVVTTHIGDDNDYSCWLRKPVYALIAAGQADLALKLANTDSMLNGPLTMTELMEQYNKEYKKDGL